MKDPIAAFQHKLQVASSFMTRNCCDRSFKKVLTDLSQACGNDLFQLSKNFIFTLFHLYSFSFFFTTLLLG